MNKISSRNLLYILISVLPLTILTGSAIINIAVIIIDVTFLYIVIKEKVNFSKDKLIFYTILLFWISLIINLIFSLNFNNSFLRIFGFLRFLILTLAIKFIIESFSKEIKKKIFNYWGIIFLCVSVDLIFEFIFGFNIFGNTSNIPGRLSGFLGEELKIGNWYYGFGLIASSYILYNLDEKKFSYALLILTIFISFLIGERANFLKYFISISFFFFLYERKFLIKKILIIGIIPIIIGLIVISNKTYKERFWTLFLENFNTNGGIIKTLNTSPYGGHWNAAWEIFIDHKIFGIGINNFRIVSGYKKYENSEVLYTEIRQNLHPHQLHLEFLSETGIFGFVSFLTFIFFSIFVAVKNFLKYNNYYTLAALLFFLTSTLIPLPAGSFFTTYSATIFWINYAIMVSKFKNKI